MSHEGTLASRPKQVQALLNRLWIDNPRTLKVLPDWDINVVMGQFFGPPFVLNGSDKDIPFQLLLVKVAFLLALAVGSRRSKLHVFARSGGFLDWTWDLV